MPKELGNLAFIPEHVYDILNLHTSPPLMRDRIRDVINAAYFGSYIRDLGAGVVIDLSHLASAFSLPSCGQNLSYLRMVRVLQRTDRLDELSTCTPSQLVRLGDDPVWQNALRSSVVRVGSMAESALVPGAREFSVLCVAAAAAEFKSIRWHLEAAVGNSVTVDLGDEKNFAVKYRDSGINWYLAGLSFQGETEAAVEILRLINVVRPTLVLMIGMCMGMPRRHLSVGTVIVPNEVAVFDHQRITESGTQIRQHGNRVDNRLYRLARIVSAERDLGFDVVADKGLASASSKIENCSSALVQHIETAFPDAVAFDMEGWGFYRATEGQPCLWIKGVADSGEAQTEEASARAAKNEIQMDATKNATDFAVRVVRSFIHSAARPS